MKNFINKTLTFLFAFALIASIASTTCNTAFAYDEVDTIAPIWIEETEEETGTNTRD